MVAQSYQSFEVVADLFTGLRPQLEMVLRRYEIPASDAATLLEEIAMELVYKGEQVEDIAGWLVARLRHRCRHYWVAKRHLVLAAMDRFFKVH